MAVRPSGFDSGVSVSRKNGVATFTNRGPQFTGGLNGRRKDSTTQALLNSGDTSTLNKKEWKRLAMIRKANDAKALAAATHGADVTGATSGPPAVPGTASMADAARLEYEQAQRQKALDTIQNQYDEDVTATGGQYATSRATGATQYAQAREAAGLAATASGVGYNPAMTAGSALADKRSFRDFATQNAAAHRAALSRLAAEAASQRAMVNSGVMDTNWDFLAGTRTKVNGVSN